MVLYLLWYSDKYKKNPSPTNQAGQQQKILWKNADNSHESNFPISDHEINVFDKDSTAKNFLSYVSQRP